MCRLQSGQFAFPSCAFGRVSRSSYADSALFHPSALPSHCVPSESLVGGGFAAVSVALGGMFHECVATVSTNPKEHAKDKREHGTRRQACLRFRL